MGLETIGKNWNRIIMFSTDPEWDIGCPK